MARTKTSDSKRPDTRRARPTLSGGRTPPALDGTVSAARRALRDFIIANGGRLSDKAGRERNAESDAALASDGKPDRSVVRFIDLFCGIGGFRLAFERAGARCVFSSDWDKFSRQTYAANFGEQPAGDINAVPVANIPSFDILCGGFPCQQFSLVRAGHHQYRTH